MFNIFVSKAVQRGYKTMKKGSLKTLVIVGFILLAVAAILIVGLIVLIPSYQYNKALDLYNNEEYLQAAEIFEKLDDYKDAQEYSKKSKNKYDYNKAISLFEIKDYEGALPIFELLGDYKDAKKYYDECQKEVKYNQATLLMENENYSEALEIFTQIEDVHSSKENIQLCQKYIEYNTAEYAFEIGNYSLAAEMYKELADFEDSVQKADMLSLLDEYYEWAEDLSDGISSINTFEASDIKELYEVEKLKEMIQPLYYRYLYLDGIESIQASSPLAINKLNKLPEGYKQRDEILEIMTSYHQGDFEEFITLTKEYSMLEHNDIRIEFLWEYAMESHFFDGDDGMDVALKAYNAAREIKSVTGIPLSVFNADYTFVFEDGISYLNRLDSLVQLCGEKADNKILILYANDSIDTNYSNICTYLMDLLPEKYIPKSLDEVEYIISLEIYDDVIDVYDTGTLAIQEVAEIKIVRCPSGNVIKNVGTFKGDEPPETFTYSGTPPKEMRGGSVDEDAALGLLIETVESYMEIKTYGEYEYIIWDDGVYINKYLGNSKSPIVPDYIDNLPVVGIRGEAFSDNKDITHITLPSELVGITVRLFKNFTYLEQITIPSKVIRIGNEAFSGCTSLVTIELNEGLKRINNNVFFGCTSLGSINLPDSIYFMGGGAFAKCTKLNQVDLPSNLTTINTGCFTECFSLKSIELPQSLQIIRKSAFSLSALEEIVLPDSLEYIGDEAFNGTYIYQISLPESVKFIDKDAFAGCSNLYEIFIPQTVVWLHPENFDAEWMTLYVKEYSCAYSALTDIENDYVKAQVDVEKYRQ